MANLDPAGFLWLEKNNNRRMLLKGLSVAGILVGGYLAYCLLTYEAGAEIRGHHIKYVLDYPRPFRGYGNIVYGLATIAPAFVSGVRGMKIFGLLVVISYLISFYYFVDALISVWCYFAAAISISVWYLVPASSEKRQIQLKEFS